MIHDIALILAAVFYIVAAALLYQSIRKPSESLRNISFGIAVAGVLAHASAQYTHWFREGVPNVGIAHLLSLCALVITVILVASTLTQRKLYSAGLVALPIAATVVIVEFFLPHQGLPLSEASTGTAVHMISSVLAFGLLCIAGVYALFVVIIDHFLRHHHLSPLVRSLPALEVLENLLFKLIGLGFILLTVSLASGVMFINDIFAQHLLHKTILSIMAWLVFGILLFGRWRYGWRGSLAVRLTVAGIVLLILSYFGTKLVLEVILGRSWQS
jgi:ABC-type uncharacterized transport system permease subunit